MLEPPTLDHQRIVSYLTYADAPSAIEWLCRVFGFEEAGTMSPRALVVLEFQLPNTG